MKVRGNWYGEEFGGGSQRELMNWKRFCACTVYYVAVHVMIELYSTSAVKFLCSESFLFLSCLCFDTLPCFQLSWSNSVTLLSLPG